MEKFIETLKNKENNTLNNLYKIPKKENTGNIPSIQIMEKNFMHFADILFLPMDKGFKYALVVTDANSKLTDAQPLKNRNSTAVINAFNKIYSRDYLDFPFVIVMDSGTEFKGKTKEYLEENKVRVRYALTNRHRQIAPVEAKNKQIGTILLKKQAFNELKTGKDDRKWVDDLPIVIKYINEKAKPIEKYKSDYPIITQENRDLIPIGTKVRAKLDYPINTATGKRLNGGFRASDIKWNPKERIIKNIILKPSQPPIYLLDGKEGINKDTEMVGRTKQQLQIIDENEKKIKK